MSFASGVPRIEKVPWFSLLIIAGVFFYTIHDVRYTRYFAERGATGYIVTEEEAEQIMSGFEQGQLANAVAYLVLGALGALSFVAGTQNRLRVRDLFSGAIIFFVCWSFLSVLWAENVPSTAKKLIIFAMLCMAVIGVLKRFSERDIVLLTFFGMAAYVAIGVISEIALGSFQPWVPGYRFSGTCHPNGQALDCGLLLFASVTLYRTDRRRIFMAVAVAAFVLLFLTKSRTAVAGVLFAPMALWTVDSTRTRKIALASLAGATVCFIILIADVALPALQKGAMMGRTDTDFHAATLTGRVDLWGEVINTYIAARPLLGYGYNSFWTLDRVERVTEAVGFIPGNAHSAFLEVFLGLGAFGFLAYVLIGLVGIIRAVQYYRISKDPVFGFFSVLLILAMFHGLTESMFLFPSFSTFISMLILARLAFQDPPMAPESDEDAVAP